MKYTDPDGRLERLCREIEQLLNEQKQPDKAFGDDAVVQPSKSSNIMAISKTNSKNEGKTEENRLINRVLFRKMKNKKLKKGKIILKMQKSLKNSGRNKGA